MNLKKISFALEIFLGLTSLPAFAGSCERSLENAPTNFQLDLGGKVSLRFRSHQNFELSDADRAALAAHLPGLREGSDESREPHAIDHLHKDAHDVERRKRGVTITAPWSEKLPPDFTHLAYGVARRAWLKKGIFPVHAACVGDDVTGYVLLVGASGSGKTSAALDAVRHGLKLFSGDKTLVRVTPSGKLEAIAGTRRLTVRREDRSRWSDIAKVDARELGDRESFALEPARYSTLKKVKIVAIYMVRLDDGEPYTEPLAPLPALHALSPLFFDKAREDVVLGKGEAIYPGSLKPEKIVDLTAALARAFEITPSYKFRGRLVGLRDKLRLQFPIDRPKRPCKKILLGICGIGNGHLNRQLPVIEHFTKAGDDVMVFAYGEAWRRLRESHPNLKLIEIANPYYVGAKDGLDFGLTARNEVNQRDFVRHNAEAIDRALGEFGRPDLVVSDYEMVSAQLAYAKNVPLVTLDQQSKFFASGFPREIEGTTSHDEVERLRLFFPAVRARLAASFFRVGANSDAVEIFPPILREGIRTRRDVPLSRQPTVYVYVTAQRMLGQTALEREFPRIAPLLPKEFDYHVYWPKDVELPLSVDNVHYYPHGLPGETDERLAKAHAVITTAGHTLLSEAMFLGKPVLAIPLPLFEQQLNAHVIDANGFGLSRAQPRLEDFVQFLENLGHYRENIRRDRKVLLREDGNDAILSRLEDLLLVNGQ